MANLEGSIKRFIGLSSDTKPSLGSQVDGSTTLTTDLPPGSSFLETDTGNIWRWDGNEWTFPFADENAQTFLLQMIYEKLDELVTLRELELTR